MEFTYLFYGFYNNTVVEDFTFSYSIPLAYIVTIAFYFVFCFMGIVARSGSDFSSFILKKYLYVNEARE